MSHDSPNTSSWVSNGLLSYTLRTQKCLLSGNHTYVTSENDTNTIEMQDVWNTLTTQEARFLP